MKRDAHIDGLYRWWLTRQWGSRKKVCWIMLNPSTADRRKDDPTLISVIKRSQNWGYGRLVVVNLYPFRSSDPDECMRWDLDQPQDSAPKERNRKHIEYAAYHSDLVVAAWGAHPDIDTISVNDLRLTLYCIGTNKDGSPKHPLARGKHKVLEATPPRMWQGKSLETE